MPYQGSVVVIDYRLLSTMQSAPLGSPRCDIAQETGIIRVGEMDIQPATVDGAEEVFSVAKFTLVKPRLGAYCHSVN